MATAAISKPEHKNKKRKKEKAEKAAEEPKAAKAPAAAKVKVPATPEEEARRQKQRECRERALAAREGGKAYVSSYKVRAKKRPQQAQRKFERRQEGLPSKAVRNTERRARKAERAIWPASAAQADDWLRGLRRASWQRPEPACFRHRRAAQTAAKAEKLKAPTLDLASASALASNPHPNPHPNPNPNPNPKGADGDHRADLLEGRG
eukprot:scaffold63693_cov71-Phaeocystis_antarctica.AAC.2